MGPQQQPPVLPGSRFGLLRCSVGQYCIAPFATASAYRNRCAHAAGRCLPGRFSGLPPSLQEMACLGPRASLPCRVVDASAHWEADGPYGLGDPSLKGAAIAPPMRSSNVGVGQSRHRSDGTAVTSAERIVRERVPSCFCQVSGVSSFHKPSRLQFDLRAHVAAAPCGQWRLPETLGTPSEWSFIAPSLITCVVWLHKNAPL